MDNEGMIQCVICHEHYQPQYIDLNWQNSGDPVCDGCGKGKDSDGDAQIEAIAGYFMERIQNLNASCRALRDGLNRAIDIAAAQKATLSDLRGVA